MSSRINRCASSRITSTGLPFSMHGKSAAFGNPRRKLSKPRTQVERKKRKKFTPRHWNSLNASSLKNASPRGVFTDFSPPTLRATTSSFGPIQNAAPSDAVFTHYANNSINPPVNPTLPLQTFWHPCRRRLASQPPHHSSQPISKKINQSKKIDLTHYPTGRNQDERMLLHFD